MELSDRLTEHHIATTDLSAVVAPAAIEMADSISPWSSSASGATLSKTDRHRIAAKLFAKAGRSAHLMSNAELHPPGRELADDGAERPDDLISLSLRTSIAADLRSAKKALRLASSIPTEENVTALEQHLLNARDTAEPVHAYRVRLDDAISCARGLREAKTGGDRLELTGRAHSAIDTVLENLMV